MACTVTWNVNDHPFTYTFGTGNGDGIAVSPTNAKLDDPDWVEALKTALEIYPVLKEFYALEEYASTPMDILMGYVDVSHETFLSRWNAIKDHDFIPENSNAEFLCYLLTDDTLRQRYMNEDAAIKSRNKKPKDYSGFVYLLKAETGHYKIGKAKNPKSRIETFTVKLPFRVEYECLVQTNDMAALEKELHAQFNSKRIDGEWFKLDNADIEYIKSLAGAK